MTEAPETERTDIQIQSTIAFRMVVAMNLFVKPFIETHTQTLKLSLPEWRCMMALASVPDSSGQDVARIMGMDRMTVSRNLRRLEKVGRAHRSTDPSNRKRFQWRLTEKGWNDYDVVAPTALEREKEFLRPLSKAQQTVLREALDAAIREMGATTEREQ